MEASESMVPNGAVEVIASKILRLPEIPKRLTKSPTFDFVDTGLLDNDGVTSNGLITVNGLESGATWQYSSSGDDGFVDGTGSSFALADNASYAVNAIQIKQTDVVGNVSDISRNTLRISTNNQIIQAIAVYVACGGD
jgi:hypothetical protein